MSEPARFLTAFAQSLATMSLYGDGHPQRERTIDSAFDSLLVLQENDSRPRFSFLGQDVIYGQMAMRELGDWDWGARLANAGVQRVEFELVCHAAAAFAWYGNYRLNDLLTIYDATSI